MYILHIQYLVIISTLQIFMFVATKYLINPKPLLSLIFFVVGIRFVVVHTIPYDIYKR